MPIQTPREGLLDRDNPPLLTLKLRPGTLSAQALRDAGAAATKPCPAAMGLLFLWHDHWHESHVLAQEHEGERDFDLLHALAHRREGDYGNSEYWLRETGAHPVFKPLGARVGKLLEGRMPLPEKILRGGKWNPRGFLAAVRADPESPLLREIQAEEFLCFYEWLLDSA